MIRGPVGWAVPSTASPVALFVTAFLCDAGREVRFLLWVGERRFVCYGGYKAITRSTSVSHLLQMRFSGCHL